MMSLDYLEPSSRCLYFPLLCTWRRGGQDSLMVTGNLYL